MGRAMNDAEQRPVMLYGALLASTGEGTPDLTLLVLAVLLQVYASTEPQTVRGLATALQVGKSSVTRSADTLERLQLVERLEDPADRRSLHLGRTEAGRTFVRHLGNRALAAAV